jgi:hypothetical protein
VADTLQIYFSGSIRGGRDDQAFYRALIRSLERYGRILTEHVGEESLSVTGEEGVSDQEVFERDMKWLRAADVLVAEVSTPSLGVGYEIAWMEHLQKPVLCLYRELPERRVSAMITGNPSLVLRKYSGLEEAGIILDDFLSSWHTSEPSS